MSRSKITEFWRRRKGTALVKKIVFGARKSYNVVCVRFVHQGLVNWGSSNLLNNERSRK